MSPLRTSGRFLVSTPHGRALRVRQGGGLFGRSTGGISPAQANAFRSLLEQLGTGDYEGVVARAQTLAGRPRRVWDRRPEPVWPARTFALTAAVPHGRREHVLPELEALTAELQHTTGGDRTMLLVARTNRAVVLLGEERYAEAEASDHAGRVPRRERAVGHGRRRGPARVAPSGEAEASARQALEECQRFLHPTHPRTGEARELLAGLAAGDQPPETPDAGADPPESFPETASDNDARSLTELIEGPAGAGWERRSVRYRGTGLISRPVTLIPPSGPSPPAAPSSPARPAS